MKARRRSMRFRRTCCARPRKARALVTGGARGWGAAIALDGRIERRRHLSGAFVALGQVAGGVPSAAGAQSSTVGLRRLRDLDAVAAEKRRKAGRPNRAIGGMSPVPSPGATDSLRAAQIALWLAADPTPLVTGRPAELESLRLADGVRLAPPPAERAEEFLARFDPERLGQARTAYRRLVVSHVGAAARRLRRSHERGTGQEGLVQFPCTPDVAEDAAAVVEQAVRVLRRLQAPNVVIGVPAGDAAAAAVHELTYRGINAAVDDVLSPDRYEQAAEAYISGLERRLAERLPLERIASLAWMPVAAVDRRVDAVLNADSPLRGAVAVALAQQLHLQASRWFAGSRWRRLAAHGAQPQRLGFSAVDTGMSSLERLALPGTVLAVTSRTLERCSAARLLPTEADETEVAWVLGQAAAAGAPVPAIAAELEHELRGEAVRAFREAEEAMAEGLRTADAWC